MRVTHATYAATEEPARDSSYPTPPPFFPTNPSNNTDTQSPDKCCLTRLISDEKSVNIVTTGVSSVSEWMNTICGAGA